MTANLTDLVERLTRERDEARDFLDNAVSKAPEPLRALGEYLGRLLDEDRWPEAERYLNAAVASLAAPATAIEHLAAMVGEREGLEHSERVEYEERILAAEMETVRARREMDDFRELARADKDRRIEIALKMLVARFPVAAEMTVAGQTAIVNAMEDFAQAASLATPTPALSREAVAELESALCAGTWAASLTHVHNALALASGREG